MKKGLGKGGNGGEDSAAACASSTREDDNGTGDRRTYSEVVVESFLEAEHRSEPSRSSKESSSEPMNDIDELEFYSGNPCIEKTTGILHFYKSKEFQEVKTAQCRMLCMLAVPAQLNSRDLLNFIGTSAQAIMRMKIVRNEAPNQYMLILRFKSHKDALKFYDEFNGVQFNSMDPDRCSLLFVESIESVTADSFLEMDSLVELPTCVVCLERLDDGVLAVLCNHSFHASCIQQWTDTSCPVCRNAQTPELEAAQKCSTCGRTKDLWLCLICGNIGCGRYEQGHARKHFEETSHTFTLQIGSSRVWDYAGDNYVHRLIQNEEDGKLVEFERNGRQERPEGEEKAEALELEYSCLLRNQLDKQREYYEKKLEDADRKLNQFEKMAQAQIEDMENQLKRAVGECTSLREQLANIQQEKSSVDKKVNSSSGKLTKALAELKEERSVNEMLRADQMKWMKTVDELSNELKTSKTKFTEEITDLKEQIRDLMLHFEAQTKINDEVATSKVTEEEMQESVLEVTNSAKSSKARRKGGKK